MIKKILYICTAALVIACSDDTIVSDTETPKEIPLSAIRTTIDSFIDIDENGQNMPTTRVSIDGDGFDNGDLIRMNVIAPFVDNSEYGESTWSSTFDNWRLYEWSNSIPDLDNDKNPDQGNLATGYWSVLGSNRGFDLNGDFKPSGSQGNIYSPQATPYVYTATTWTEEIHHIISTDEKPGGTIVLSFSNIFKADQRRIENYKASDVLWAQTFLQTGSENIALSFQHKMAALKITLGDDFLKLLDKTTTAPEIVLTLENMPDIDQQEIIIGNYYAARLKAHTQAYCEWQRSACDYNDNGKVLGIVSINQDNSRIERKALTPQADNASYDLPKFDGTTPTNIKLIGVEQTGTYTAYKDSKTSDEKTIISFLLIIPPYTVPDDVTPTLWLRQGKSRWSAPLPLPNERTFESGKRYNIQMNKPTA